MTKQRSAILGALLGVLMLAFVVSSPATRAWASDMLSVFRVAKFAPISVSPQQLAFLEEVMSNSEGLYPGEIELVEDPEPSREFSSLSAAASHLQQSEYYYGIRTLDAYGEPEIYVESGGEATLTVDLASARKLLEAANIDPLLLPDSLDDQDVTANVGTLIAQEFDGALLVQTVAPEINYPDGVNPQPIGEALLLLLGMEPGDAKRLAQNIEWGSTLVMPIPAEFATFSEVPVDGTTGLAIEAIDGSGTSLMWQSGGMVYMLTADVADADELLDIADSLTWFYQ